MPIDLRGGAAYVAHRKGQSLRQITGNLHHRCRRKDDGRAFDVELRARRLRTPFTLIELEGRERQRDKRRDAVAGRVAARASGLTHPDHAPEQHAARPGDRVVLLTPGIDGLTDELRNTLFAAPPVAVSI